MTFAPHMVLLTCQERANTPFNIRKLAVAMHGSEKALVLKEKFMAEVRARLLQRSGAFTPCDRQLIDLDRSQPRIQDDRYTRSHQGRDP